MWKRYMYCSLEMYCTYIRRKKILGADATLSVFIILFSGINTCNDQELKLFWLSSR